MYKIGIECESIEDSEQWGVGRIISKLLEEISKKPELSHEFRFYLYFKSQIPDYSYLKNPIFVKKIVKPLLVPSSFSLYYYVYLPIKLWFENLDLMYFPNYMLPLIFKGKSIVTVTPDILKEMHSTSMPFKYRLAYKIFTGHAIKHATALNSVSETAVEELRSHSDIKTKKIFATPLGVDASKFKTPKNTKPSIVQGDFVLFVAQAFPRRHLKETILAIDKLQSEFPNLKLVAIGKDKYPSVNSGQAPFIKSLVEKINKKHAKEVIIYKEYVSEDELIALYQNAKSFVYISSSEAFGLPTLEALTAGSVPVVADVKLNDEIYGQNAFKVKLPADSDKITQAIKESLTNKQKRQQIINAAPEITEKYAWEKHTDKTLKIFRKLANNNPE
ncbi:MAG: hypothetical protein COV29_01600 [Candidatus Yanofskybacteria bacterium CG10_big_fil_rev_8_21_14_0_10_36_16]|uniref:Glycosyl transferase family 1 domain-containing protein n=1 Tax=Candidatus Yanofskybacteria bacterium CG10_big_fil_rev_8_21_14_0_10_36_16 TaxID=1975096 RepID=A0A2J0Q7F9_9BACT|nr:MAG: hypothetical protein COV29_01600 [Candidatus Yanofskybacteria bacterium CG10_big_fil_rev_8_21_14_0_10_36_16]